MKQQYDLRTRLMQRIREYMQRNLPNISLLLSYAANLSTRNQYHYCDACLGRSCQRVVRKSAPFAMFLLASFFVPRNEIRYRNKLNKRMVPISIRDQ